MNKLTRYYLALCLIGLATFSWAEYKGYVLTGDDESARTTSHGPGSSVHHK